MDLLPYSVISILFIIHIIRYGRKVKLLNEKIEECQYRLEKAGIWRVRDRINLESQINYLHKRINKLEDKQND